MGSCSCSMSIWPLVAWLFALSAAASGWASGGHCPAARAVVGDLCSASPWACRPTPWAWSGPSGNCGNCSSSCSGAALPGSAGRWPPAPPPGGFPGRSRRRPSPRPWRALSGLFLPIPAAGATPPAAAPPGLRPISPICAAWPAAPRPRGCRWPYPCWSWWWRAIPWPAAVGSSAARPWRPWPGICAGNCRPTGGSGPVGMGCIGPSFASCQAMPRSWRRWSAFPTPAGGWPMG